MAPANQPAYQKDERVLCFHHEILYEAKILDIRHTDPDDRKSPYEYLVHYKGWKNTYVSLSCSVSLPAQEACSVPKISIFYICLSAAILLFRALSSNYSFPPLC